MNTASEMHNQKKIKLDSSEISAISLGNDVYKKCLCRHDNQDVMKFIINLTSQQDKQSLSELLTGLSIIVNLYDTSSSNICERINEMRSQLANNEEFLKHLVTLLGHKNRVVAFSSCKAIRRIMSIFSIKIFSEEVLQDLMLGFEQDTVIQERHPTLDLMNLRIFTFDTWKGILKNLRTMDEGCYHVEDSVNPDNPCTNCVHLQEANPISKDDRMAYMELLKTKLPKTLDCIHEQLTENPHNNAGVVLIAYVDLMVEVVKHFRQNLPRSLLDIIMKLMPYIETQDSVLCKRILDVMNQIMHHGNSEFTSLDVATVTIATNYMQVITAERLEKLLPNDGFVGFGGALFTDRTDEMRDCELLMEKDNVLLRKLASLALASCCVNLQVILEMLDDQQKQTVSCTDVLKCLECLSSFLSPNETNESAADCISVWICDVFNDQDDDLVSALLVSFHIYSKAKKLSVQVEDQVRQDCIRICQLCNPHQIFVTFLQSISFDHSVPLDWLISSETHFLEYFVKYLKFASHDWDNVCKVCESFDKSNLHSVMMSSCEELGQNPMDFTSYVHGLTSAEPFNQVKAASDSKHLNENEETYSKDSHGENSRPQLDAGVSTEGQADVVMATEASKSPRTIQNDFESLEPHYDMDSASAEESDSDSSDENTLQEIMTFLTEIRDTIERLQRKNLFPYSPKALLKLLNHIHSLYEQ
ncbi:protein Lines homolog 1-like [Ptychodera flava]|uniref:protein Lines homolog 1-like n=1 Tax=Ptychodera flava TaxID=63121 RepID=UPI00396A9CA4